MQQLRVESFTVSGDGFGAGPGQDLDNPLGRGMLELHEWMFATARFREMFGQNAGETGQDNDIVARGFEGIGAWIMGRNMFGPIRGEGPDDEWKGWWGDEPPFHCPEFVERGPGRRREFRHRVASSARILYLVEERVARGAAR